MAMQYKHATILLLLVIIGTGILTVAVFERRNALEDSAATLYSETGAVPEDIDQYLLGIATQDLEEGEYREANVDLDGDGTSEQIVLTVNGNRETGYSGTLTINGVATVIPNMSNLQGYFGIVDLNTSDANREIAVSDLGPSSDYVTAFYGWDDHAVVYLNRTPDVWENMSFNGDGTFEATTRAGLLDTWFYRGVYKISDDTIVAVPQDFYAREPVSGTEVTALKNVTFQASPSDTVVSMALEAGEKANVLGCDHVQNEETAIAWCSIADEAVPPNVGWFKVADFLMEDFSGFSFAD